MTGTLLGEENFLLAVRIMNITDHNCSLKTWTYIEKVEEIEICKNTDESPFQEDYKMTDHQTLNPKIGDTWPR